MARRELDATKAKCRVCGKLYVEGDGVYSLADRFDETVTDRDVLVEFCHWDCHTPINKLFDNLRDASKRAEDALDRLRKQL